MVLWKSCLPVDPPASTKPCLRVASQALSLRRSSGTLSSRRSTKQPRPALRISQKAAWKARRIVHTLRRKRDCLGGPGHGCRCSQPNCAYLCDAHQFSPRRTHRAYLTYRSCSVSRSYTQFYERAHRGYVTAYKLVLIGPCHSNVQASRNHHREH